MSEAGSILDGWGGNNGYEYAVGNTHSVYMKSPIYLVISPSVALPLRGLIGREATAAEARMGQGRGDGRVAIGCACGHLGARRGRAFEFGVIHKAVGGSAAIWTHRNSLLGAIYLDFGEHGNIARC